MSTEHRNNAVLQAIPNVLTLLRVPLAVSMFIAAVQHHWTVAFWLMIAALATDFLDGMAARALNAYSNLGKNIDALSDSTLGVLGLVSLGITRVIDLWVLAVMFIVGAVISSDWIFPNQPKLRYRTIVGVAGLFICWITVILCYAAQAFGWKWWYVALLMGVLLCAGSIKKHRIQSWLRNEE